MDAKQEILDLLALLRDWESHVQVGLIEDRVDRIRAILETHDLVPVDTRPFDPTLCGFMLVYEGDKIKSWESERHFLRRVDGYDRGRACVTLQARADDDMVVWPATQSDGETLLRLLGVLK